VCSTRGEIIGEFDLTDGGAAIRSGSRCRVGSAA